MLNGWSIQCLLPPDSHLVTVRGHARFPPACELYHQPRAQLLLTVCGVVLGRRRHAGRGDALHVAAQPAAQADRRARHEGLCQQRLLTYCVGPFRSGWERRKAALECIVGAAARPSRTYMPVRGKSKENMPPSPAGVRVVIWLLVAVPRPLCVYRWASL